MKLQNSFVGEADFYLIAKIIYSYFKLSAFTPEVYNFSKKWLLSNVKKTFGGTNFFKILRGQWNSSNLKVRQTSIEHIKMQNSKISNLKSMQEILKISF